MAHKHLSKIIQSLESAEYVLSQSRFEMTLLDSVDRASQLLIDTFNNQKKVLLAGNGGSAGDAQHIAGEFVSRFMFDRNPLQIGRAHV